PVRVLKCGTRARLLLDLGALEGERPLRLVAFTCEPCDLRPLGLEPRGGGLRHPRPRFGAPATERERGGRDGEGEDDRARHGRLLPGLCSTRTENADGSSVGDRACAAPRPVEEFPIVTAASFVA